MNTYQNNKVNDYETNPYEEWGQFDDLENYDIFEIQSVNVNVNKNTKKPTTYVKQNNSTIINIRNSFNSFCDIYNINIELDSLISCCRFWTYLSALTLTIGLTSYFTKTEICEKENK